MINEFNEITNFFLNKDKISFKQFIPSVDFIEFYNFLSNEEILEAKKFYLQIRNIQPFANFYLGLIYEFGITEKIDNMISLMYYLEGASKYDPYCTYRLYFIYRDETNKFNLIENFYLEFKYIILSALFSSNYDNRFNKRIFDPQGSLKIIIKLLDNITINNFFKLYINENYFDGYTFKLIFTILFLNDHNNQLLDPSSMIDHLISFVSKYQTPQALFLIGKIYFYGCKIIEYDDKQAYSFLSRSAISGFSLAMNLLVENIYDLQYFDEFVKTVLKFSESYTHNSLRYYANEIAKTGINNKLEQEKALNLYKKAIYLGDFWSLFEYCELLDKTINTNANYYYIKAMIIYNNRMNIGNILMESSKLILIYKCYSKGIGCQKDLTFISKILKEFRDQNAENFNNFRFVRGLLYYAKILMKQNQIDDSNIIYARFFDKISEILHSKTENNKNFMLFSMKAKCLEKGRGCTKDLDKSLLHYQLSLKYKIYFFYFEQKHKMKIEAAIERMKSISSLSNSKNQDNLMCVICLFEMREILFEECKHLVICNKCMNKMVNKKECPICRSESKTIKIYY